MARLNKTRTEVAQKKGVCVAVIPFVEADIVGDVDGAVYVQIPERTIIQNVTSNITTASGTANATLDVLANGVVLVNELPVAAANIDDETLIAAARYLANGGELTIRPGAVAPANGALVGELIVEYIELDKRIGEYTEFLNS